MTDVPPDPEELDDVDELYRRASALDGGGPSESVRRAVLDHAARLAAERAAAESAATVRARNNAVDMGAAKPRTTRQTWWKPAAVGTLAAAALAGLLITPQFLHSPPPRQLSSSPTQSAVPQVPASEPRAPRSDAAPSTGNPVESFAKSAPAARQSASQAQRSVAAPNDPVAPDMPSAQDQLDARNKLNVQGELGERAAVDARRMANAPPTSAPGTTDAAAELRRAAEAGDIPSLQASLAKRPPLDARDAGGRTALMLAAQRGRAQAVDLLLASGADPNVADALGMTPLQVAAAGDQPAIVTALRRAGAR